MTTRKPTQAPQQLITVTVRLPLDEAQALANAVYVVTSWKAINAAQRAIQAVQAAVRKTTCRERGSDSGGQ